jgi:N-methylhydantoinase A
VLCDVASASLHELERTFALLEARGTEELLEQGVDAATIAFRRSYDARYAGQSFELSIPHGDSLDDVASSFHQAHRNRYGYHVPEERIELVNARSNASGKLPRSSQSAAREPVIPSAAPQARSRGTNHRDNVKRRVWMDEQFVTAPIYQRDSLEAGATIDGPAIVEQYDTTTYVPDRWKCEAGENLVLVRL